MPGSSCDTIAFLQQNGGGLVPVPPMSPPHGAGRGLSWTEMKPWSAAANHSPPTNLCQSLFYLETHHHGRGLRCMYCRFRISRLNN